ncbi:hypothetical protein [Nonomuraea polychroma]|uniref:hypothetical protein n=1 Tax=Nonomuraea polychroma TaxID=46176 RepID=UPI000FDE3CFA|nr:hypothetical protein [Nonomuraea polychroma]
MAPDTKAAWVVGSWHAAEDQPAHGRIGRWDDSRWQVQRLGEDRSFWTVDASGPRNVWMAGGRGAVRRWDGERYHDSQPAGPDYHALDLAVDGRRAVLTSTTWNAGDPVAVVSWDGERVTKTFVDFGFRAVAAGQGHTWIAGVRKGDKCGPDQPMVSHRAPGDRGFHPVSVPGDGALAALAYDSPSNVWAVGRTGDACGRDNRPLILHWDGRSWQKATLPDWTGKLTTVGASGREVWAAGVDEKTRPWQVMTLHFDGSRWTREYVMVGNAEDEDVVTSVRLARVPGTSRMWLAGSLNDAAGFVYRSR